MTLLQRQARALGDPTRERIFRHVAANPEGVDVAELTSTFGFNHNAIRQHLAKLVDAELITVATQKSGGRGRPKLVYRLDPSAESRWGVVGPYERLSMLLTEIIRTGDDPATVGQRSGRESRIIGDDVSIGDLADHMARQGFEPEIQVSDGDEQIVLHTCPFESAALGDPDTVCRLHLGLAMGMTEDTGFVVDSLARRDPSRGECVLALRRSNDREPAEHAAGVSSA